MHTDTGRTHDSEHPAEHPAKPPHKPHPKKDHGHIEHARAHKQGASTSDADTGTTFAALGLAAPVLRALKDEGYESPTPIQAAAIGPAMAGRDLLGIAQTGTGKTAAFAVPILHRLFTQPVDKSRRGPALPRALILSPTRELATQIAESFSTYGRHTGLVNTVIFGGVSQFHQVKAIHRGLDILVATPGRLIDLMDQRLVSLQEIDIFVLDEADRMLDMGFIQPIRRIASALPSPTTHARQTMLFSATMPREITQLAHSLLHDPARIEIAHVARTAALIEQKLYYVLRVQKPVLLHHLLESLKVQRAVVFVKTKFGADKVHRRLVKEGISAVVIHGNKAQNHRTRAIEAFRGGRARVLVATDVAARGLDVDGITHVFNMDLPMEAEAYVHRIGRTGRAGASGNAISFCDPEERGLLRDIERLTGKKLPTEKLPELPAVEVKPRDDSHQDRDEDHSQNRNQYRDARDHHPRAAHRSSNRGPNRGPSHGPNRAPDRAPRERSHSDRSPRDFEAPREGRGSAKPPHKNHSHTNHTHAAPKASAPAHKGNHRGSPPHASKDAGKNANEGYTFRSNTDRPQRAPQSPKTQFPKTQSPKTQSPKKGHRGAAPGGSHSGSHKSGKPGRSPAPRDRKNRGSRDW
jgi:ATP-dependent RNA helicase RhlE